MVDSAERRSTPRVHDLIAPAYDAARPIPPLLQAAIGSQVREFIPAGPIRMLDVGAGTGSVRWLDDGHSRGTTVRMDHSLTMLTRAKTHDPRLCGEATSLPFRDDAFDAVGSRHLLEGLPERAQVIREMERVLRPGAPYLHATTRPPHYLREIHTWWRHQTNLVRIVDGGSHGYEAPPGSVELDLVMSGASIARATTMRIPVTQSLDEVLAGYAQKAYPSCWQITDDAHSYCIEELTGWARQKFGDVLTGSFQTAMIAARW